MEDVLETGVAEVVEEFLPESPPDAPAVESSVQADAATVFDPTLETDVAAVAGTEPVADVSEPTAAVVEVISTPAADPVAPELSPSEREFIGRKPAIDTALSNLAVAEAELAETVVEEENIKKKRKGREAAQEAAHDALKRACMGLLTNNQMPLPFAPHTPATATAAPIPAGPTAAQQETLANWDDHWQAFIHQDVDVLAIPVGLKEKLREEGVDTLKKLADVKAANAVMGFQDIPGVGKARADVLEDAFAVCQETFLKAHPNPRPPAAPSEPVASVSTDYDFVTTFPEPVNPTPNEAYDEAYHRSVIDDAIAEVREIRAATESLAQDTESAKPMKPTKRAKVEQRLAETKAQHATGLGIYSEKFGKKAAERLEKHVQDQFETEAKRETLKGGID